MISKEQREFIEKLHSVNSVAKMEGVTVQNIYKKLRKGKYEFVKIDGKTFIKIDK